MTTTVKTIAICYIIITIKTLNTNAQTCDTDCTVCPDESTCAGSALLCAYSTGSKCISIDQTPFIFINEAGTQGGGYSWYEAEVRCQTLHNTHLASVRSAQEHEWAVSLCKNAGVQSACWIGGYLYYADNPDGDFMWLDGADFTYGADPHNQPPWQIGKSQPTFDGCDGNNNWGVCALKVRINQPGKDGWTDLPNADSVTTQTEPAFCRRDCICPDDGNPCTEEICQQGECVHNPVTDTTACNTDCVPNGKCFEGACIGNIECGNAACDGLCCNDDNPCMENTVCSELICSGIAVSDGESCTIGCIVGSCNNGQCLDGVVDCSLGCEGTRCDDDNDLTIDDICIDGVCIGAPLSSPPTANPLSSPPTAAPLSSPPTADPLSSPPTAAPLSSPPTADPSIDPTASSDESSSESSDENDEDVSENSDKSDEDVADALFVADNNQLPETNSYGNDNTYNLTVESNNKTWTYLWLILGTFFVCNGVSVWYWYRSNAKKCQK
eukprot:334841_1